MPQGSYFMLADVSHLGYPSAQEAAMAVLKATKVASVPGSAFYAHQTGEKFLRFCFASKYEVIKEACKRIQNYYCR
ncbi:MAG: hypothetical protein D3923_20210 [Candidatus Electrothrix sp. AR3]|nr:hypothetical protein [Candidatus Electrothrix sp. AR3]